VSWLTSVKLCLARALNSLEEMAKAASVLGSEVERRKADRERISGMETSKADSEYKRLGENSGEIGKEEHL
jgi:hypothetical protein